LFCWLVLATNTGFTGSSQELHYERPDAHEKAIYHGTYSSVLSFFHWYILLLNLNRIRIPENTKTIPNIVEQLDLCANIAGCALKCSVDLSIRLFYWLPIYRIAQQWK
jgi:hypothetical protein